MWFECLLYMRSNVCLSYVYVSAGLEDDPECVTRPFRLMPILMNVLLLEIRTCRDQLELHIQKWSGTSISCTAHLSRENPRSQACAQDDLQHALKDAEPLGPVSDSSGREGLPHDITDASGIASDSRGFAIGLDVGGRDSC